MGEEWIEDTVGAITDPLIVFDVGWAEDLPPWLKTQITLERLAQPLKGERGVATDAEALLYVSNASLAVPLSSDWVAIYGYLTTLEAKDKMPEDMRRDEISEHQKRQLQDLKKWLWERRMATRKERRAKARAEERAEVEAKAPKQLAMF